MKVICIDTGILNLEYSSSDGEKLIICEVYTVIGEGINPTTQNECFILAEVKSSNAIGGYNKRRFIPLSDIDETELTNIESDLLTDKILNV